MIDARAETSPDASALVAPGRAPLSYRELRGLVHSAAAALNAFGVARTDRVAVVLPNGPELAAVMVAAAAYATCAPLNPGYQPAEFRRYLGDLRPSALLLSVADNGAARRCAGDRNTLPRCLVGRRDARGQVRICRLGEPIPCAGARRRRRRHRPGPVYDRHDGAFKLVPLTQRNLCASAAHVAATLALGPDDRCLNVMPLFHIHGIVAALLASLSAGASVACTPGPREGKLLLWIDELRPTWYTAVPTVHEAVLAELRRNPARPIAGRFRFVRSSSAPLSPKVMRELEAALGAPVIEAYGMTEAAHQIASNPLPPKPRRSGSVGLAAGPEVAILDPSGDIVRRDAAGEIVIRGPNVTTGYVGNPAANRAAFHDGWFRTGDLGRIDVDGYVTIAGRLQEAINRGGEKVSPRDVDEALLEHPEISRAVAFAVSHASLGEDIAAAVVLKSGSHASEQAIREFLFARLAAFKIPSRILIVDDIPLGDTGKIRRVGLAAHFADRLKPARVAPRDEIEVLVAGIFAEVLAVEAVAATDNFFALGGDSLRGGQVLARLGTRLDVVLPPLALFKSPTVAEFAREIRSARKDAADAGLAEALTRIEQLSDEEAEKLVATRPRRGRR